MLAPFEIAARIPGFSLANLRCFRLKVVCMAGSTNKCEGVTGDILFGSPAFAIPLNHPEMRKNENENQ
jgi:hypothetical protein